MPALLVNIKIDCETKLNHFKVTSLDLLGIFDECHMKVRGAAAAECIDYAKSNFGGICKFYQELQETDWVAATSIMLANVKSRSVFLYFEDHRLVSSTQHLKQVLTEFDECQLDYLCYSFFRASQLNLKNMLPLNPKLRDNFSEFKMTERNLELVGRISPRYCVFSLVSIVSIRYLRSILQLENNKYKIYIPLFVRLLIRLFPYPQYRKVFDRINLGLGRFSIRLCGSSPSSPFNLEKCWYECLPRDEEWNFGVLRTELFANYDDDNGADGESLIKRNAYPFHGRVSGPCDLPSVTLQIALEAGETYDCSYNSHNARIRCAPQLTILVISGQVIADYCDSKTLISAGDTGNFYANLGPVIESRQKSQVRITVYDEAF
jgi:hypothetical protein